MFRSDICSILVDGEINRTAVVTGVCKITETGLLHEIYVTTDCLYKLLSYYIVIEGIRSM